MKAKQLIMMAKGEKKADLVKRMIYGEVTSDSLVLLFKDIQM